MILLSVVSEMCVLFGVLIGIIAICVIGVITTSNPYDYEEYEDEKDILTYYQEQMLMDEDEYFKW